MEARQVGGDEGPSTVDPQTAPPSRRTTEWIERIAVFAFGSLLVVLPFLVVDIPPSLDLPQHAAQVRLAREVLAGGAPAYELRWWVPYTFSYAVLAATTSAFGSILGATYGLALLSIGWGAAFHLLAAVRGRSAAAATLAALCVFSCSLYWGFISYLSAIPALVAWVTVTSRAFGRLPSRSELAILLGLELWMWTAHLLVAVIGVVWLVVLAVARRRSHREAAAWLALATPLVLACAAFYPTLKLRAFSTPALWQTLPTFRLKLTGLEYATFGDLRGWLETVVFAVMILWLVVATLQHRRAPWWGFEPMLLAAAATLWMAFLLLPDSVDNTILFARRWAAPAMAFTLVAAPTPRRPRAALVVVPAITALALSIGTALAWARFEARELSGLREAIHLLPPQPRVLGLAFTQESDVVDGTPFLQTFAWAQVERGGTLNFSFAEYAPFPVVLRDRSPRPWTPNLEWFPSHVLPRDLSYFDFVIANGSAADHRRMVSVYGLLPVTRRGAFRLYRIPHSPVGEPNR